MLTSLVRATLALVAIAFSTHSHASEEVQDFYKDKQIRIVVGTAPGTGYDIVARAIAQHLGRHIPGQPSVIVQNLPGAGSVRMTNQLFHAGPKDGTVIGASINGMPTAPLLQPDAGRFDPAKLNWLGSPHRETMVAIAWHTAPVQSLDALKTRQLIIAATTPGTGMIDFPLVANGVLGLKFKIVRGYEGSVQTLVAMESGEAQGVGGTSWSALKVQRPAELNEKKITVVAQWGFKREPDLPDVPSMIELAKTTEQEQALRFLLSRQEYGKPYFLPPDVPPTRVQALRAAFDATMKDPAFLADADKLQFQVDPANGDNVRKLVTDALATPPEVVARVRSLLAAP
jgi:tripartite-type tricarboxylate transporter receptor subunit TctC